MTTVQRIREIDHRLNVLRQKLLDVHPLAQSWIKERQHFAEQLEQEMMTPTMGTPIGQAAIDNDGPDVSAGGRDSVE